MKESVKINGSRFSKHKVARFIKAPRNKKNRRYYRLARRVKKRRVHASEQWDLFCKFNFSHLL